MAVDGDGDTEVVAAGLVLGVVQVGEEGVRAGRGATRASSRASSGVIQADTEVAKDLPRKGPRGTYSQAWMSRADQSLRRQRPKTWSRKEESGTGVPLVEGAPTTKPTSASMSSRTEGPKTGAVSEGALRWPEGRTTSVPDTTTVPERPW